VSKKFKPIDISKAKTYKIEKRKTKVELDDLAKTLNKNASFKDFFKSLPNILAVKDLRDVAKAVVAAKKKGKPVIFGLGAHVIKCGLSPLIIELMKQGFISAIALNGAGAIHDFEIATIGRTSEDVGEGLKEGLFGMVKETADNINSALKACHDGKTGFGEAVGQKIIELKAPNAERSILAEGLKNDVPVTVFVAMGTDTIHMHPSMDAKATGEGSFTDFKVLSGVVSELNDGGVYLNIGSTVILPEVFLKALNMARNIKGEVKNFTTAPFDMIAHYRPRVNVVTRPTEGSGKGYNIIGHHEIMIPLLSQAIIEEA